MTWADVASTLWCSALHSLAFRCISLFSSCMHTRSMEWKLAFCCGSHHLGPRTAIPWDHWADFGLCLRHLSWPCLHHRRALHSPEAAWNFAKSKCCSKRIDETWASMSISTFQSHSFHFHLLLLSVKVAQSCRIVLRHWNYVFIDDKQTENLRKRIT